ncbi:MAG TPA: carbamoyltransferase HypF [Candidatus Methylacidiphilales bacterium]|jgi:hydrogenase maturation protein HypF|nr:carbamoyltransferase HypF [Candidatus Methylacidiphilales bacterium]
MSTHNERARAIVRGVVQDVGFRSFIYRLAQELNLAGWVLNSVQGMIIEVEGAGAALRQFLTRLERERPPRTIIQSLEFSFLDAAGYKDFIIRTNEETDAKPALILPDIAACPHCLLEIFQSGNRRYRYPFTNCTSCGPRFTIIEELPYDRPSTSMKEFAMCAQCEREYRDPADRRFQAQPNACPSCGPHLELWDTGGNVLARHDDAIHLAMEDVRAGKIVALKGLGGFQLIADARDESAVKRLRERKRHSEKPFALMYPSLDLAREHCRISELEERLLLSPEAPIVLLQRWSPPLAPSIAPGNPNLGVMLPSTPLHHLFLRGLGFPVVATSGNLGEEPICTDEYEALKRLDGIADSFLVHDRPIVRPMDDSVVRVVRGREMVLRRARGYAPLPVHLKTPLPRVLAVGAHLKNTIALSVGREVFIGQHIGDLETGEAHAAFRAVAADLPRLYEAPPEAVACDLHPDDPSSRYAAHRARQMEVPLHPVQHHWAHVLSCMAENEVEFPALGVAWDGAGYGPDGTIWGGEFLLAGERSFERAAHFHHFRLPGGEAAIKQPRRSALGVLHEAGGAKALDQTDLAPVRDFPEDEFARIRKALVKGSQAPVTSSVGRLFDAVASIAGLRQQSTFEGQAAMELEFAIQPCIGESYSFEIKSTSPSVVDWRPMIGEIVEDVRRGSGAGVISTKFHNALVEIIIAVARHVGQTRVVLTGDCFQNRYLTERSVQRLLEEGFRPYWHQRVPTNDGGIALGQIVAAARNLSRPQEANEIESKTEEILA